MKKVALIIIILLSGFFLMSGNFVNAVTPTSSPEEAQKQLDDLKDRIASRVAQLKLVEKRGIVGIVTDATNTQITLSDIKGDTRFIDVDELTKFYGINSNQTFGISDISKGQTLGILGLYNKESRRLLARSVDELSAFEFVNGSVSLLDPDNFIIKVATENQKEISVEVETTTKTWVYGKDGILTRAGFSKIKLEQNIIVLGTPDKNDKNKIAAGKIIFFSDQPKNPKVMIVPELNPTAIPSTGSAGKVTPIK